MVESIIVTLLGSYAGVMIMFIAGLYVSRYFNSPDIFHVISVLSSASIILIFVYLKLQSSWFAHNPLLTFAFSAFNIVLTLRFLELSFAYKWSYIRQISLKLVVMYLLAFPQMPASEAKLLESSNEGVRRENILSIMHGIVQFVILQILLYLTPSEWLAISSVPFSLVFRFFHYGLLSIILYLSMDCVTTFGFGIYGFLTNLRMNSLFPSFPFASTSLRDLWSYRWNNLVKSSLHSMSFVVIPKLVDPIMPMSKLAKALVAFTLSGFIHEYGVWFITSKWSGRNMLFFLLHGLFTLLEVTIKLPVRPQSLHGKIIGWMWTIGVCLITSPLFFDPLIEAGVFANLK